MEIEKDIQKLPEVRKYTELRRSHPPTDKFRLKEIPGFDDLNNSNMKPAAENNLDNAFCQDDLKVDFMMNKYKSPTARNEGAWIDRVLEKERKYKREETKLAHDRLKMIEKKTLYHDREILSPITKARMPEATPILNGKKELIHFEDQGVKIEKKEPVLDKRKFPRSLSRKELNPLSPRGTNKTPLFRPNMNPIAINYN